MFKPKQRPGRGKSDPGRPAAERFNANRWRERECRFDIKYSAEPTFGCGEVRPVAAHSLFLGPRRRYPPLSPVILRRIAPPC